MIEACETNTQDFWGILFHFANCLGKTLPIIVRSRIIELECEILLRLIWKPFSSEQKTDVEKLFSSDNTQATQMIQKLLNILAERIYLITNELKIQDEVKETIWVCLKYLILRGEAFQNKKPLLKGMHLDVMLLCTIYHVFLQQRVLKSVEQIIGVYQDKVLFPAFILKEDV